MRSLFAAILALFLASVLLTGWRILSQTDMYIVGGEFTVPAGQVIHGSVRAMFAQIKLPDGARVDGTITAVSSTLDLAGSVGGSILAIGSDVTVRMTAQLAENPQRFTQIPYVVLLPRLLRTGATVAQVQ